VIVHGQCSSFGQPVNWIAADIVRVKDPSTLYPAPSGRKRRSLKKGTSRIERGPSQKLRKLRREVAREMERE
jgi:hypothetical protein